MRSALVLSFSDLRNDPRVSRQLRWLASSWRVTAAGWTDPQLPGVAFHAVHADYATNLVAKLRRGVGLLTQRFEAMYWRMAGQTLATLQDLPRHDLILANDPDTWPLAVRLGQHWRAKIIMDAHEYAPCEFEESWKWRLFRQRYAVYLSRTYLPQADGFVTIGTRVAEAYGQLVGRVPLVVTNAPDYHPDLSPRPYVAGQPIRVVHHGGAIPARRIEMMVDIAMQLDERFETTFLLVGNPDYQARLQQRAAGHPRIHFPSPVPMTELPRYLNAFDIGLYFLPPTSFNNQAALPNKLFEYIQARLSIAINPLPEMARVVQACGNGLIAPDSQPNSLATLMNTLTPEAINQFKHASHAHARDYSADKNREALLRLCDIVSNS